ncbi:MAG: hypothetical protein ACKVU1_06395 [bacterium]
MRRVIAVALFAAIAITMAVALPRDASAVYNSLVDENRMWVGAGITQGLRDRAKLGGQFGFGLTHYYTDRWGVGLELDYSSANSPRDDITGVLRVHQSVECVFRRFADHRPFLIASHGFNHWLESKPAFLFPTIEEAGLGYGVSVGIGTHLIPASDAYATLLAQYHHTFGVDASRPIVSVTLAIGW